MEAQSYNSSGGLYKQVKQLAFLLAFILFGSIAGSAQRVININKESSGLRSIKSVLVNQTISSYYGKSLKAREFEYNPELSKLTSNNVGDTIQLDFFEDSQYKAVIKNVTHDINGVTGITAKITGSDIDFCYIAISNAGISINTNILSKNESYIAAKQNGLTTYLCRYETSEISKKILPCEGILPNVEASISVSNLKSHSRSVSTPQRSNIAINSETLPSSLNTSFGITAALTDAVTINLMIIYSAEAATWAASNATNIANAISLALSEANTAMSNSGTGITFAVAYSYQTTYNESALTNENVLHYLTDNGDGIFDEVHSLRKQYNVDVVSFFRSSKTGDSGGVGWVLDKETGASSLAFNVCNIGQVTWTTTMVHEIGHNMGCAHHPNQVGSGLYVYSHGYRGTYNGKDNTVETNRYSTIMTYTNFDGTNYPAIDYFSSPDISLSDGTVIGDVSVGNNVLTLKRTKRLVSYYSDMINVALSGLSVSQGSLSPAFNSETTDYTVNVENSVSSITITGTTNSAGATVIGNVSNEELSVGANEFVIHVKSYDGLQIKSYKVTVNRVAEAKASYTSYPAFGSSVTAVQGADALNLNMSATPPTVTNTIPTVLTGKSILMIIKESSTSNAGKSNGYVSYLNDMVKFRVSTTGVYTFYTATTYVLSIFNSPTPSTGSFIASSGYFIASNSYAHSNIVSATLTAGTDYYFNIIDPGATATKVDVLNTINYSLPEGYTASVGNTYTETIIPYQMSYTYVAVSTADSKIKMQSPTAAFRTLAVGAYTIYGIPYSSGSNPEAFIGHTLDEITTSDKITASSTSLSMTVQLVNAETPTISTQPAGASYSMSATATALSVTASVSDGGTLSYQWYSNTSNNNTNGSPISGATASSYTPPTTAVGTFYYYVVVTNTNNNAVTNRTATSKSNVATITVSAIVNAASPNISAQPTGSTYTQGATATALSVSATSSDSGTLSYQWYSNATNSNSGGTPISNATSASYTPSTATVGTFYYYVVVTNTNNNVNGTTTAITTSNAITVTVNAPTYGISIGSFTGGSIAASSPKSANGNAVEAGETVTLTITPNTGYELKTLSVYKTGESGTLITVSASHTFTMPAYGVTIAATFDYTSNQKIVNAAKTAIQSGSYVLAQSDAYDQTSLKAALLVKINQSLTNYTVADGNLTINSYAGATAGAVGNLNGTNGSFNFTVSNLHLDGTTTETATNNGVITATTAYTITKSSATNGAFTVDKEAAIPGATITITASPNLGYELNNVTVTNGSSPVSTTGSGNARTFTMPAANVTVGVTFEKTADQNQTETAQGLINNGMTNVTVAQATANTESAIKSWLATTINVLAGMNATGISVTANDITLSNFHAAVAGGGNGSFTFTVALKLSQSSTVITSAKSGTITATPMYSITVNSSENGTVSANKSADVANATITLTVTPTSAIYELNTLIVKDANGNTITTTLSGTNYTFTLPSSNVTVTATFKKTANQLAVETAQSLINALSSVSVAQATANSEAIVKTWLAEQINSLNGMSGTGITVITDNIVISNFHAAVAGTQTTPAGTPGSFSFTVSLTKGNSSATTTSKNGTITPTGYAGTYSITVQGTTNGTVTANPTAASSNGTVTLTITPNAGYQLKTLTAAYGSSSSVTLSGSGNSRTFTMPAANVTVAATFEKTADQTAVETAQGLINAMTNLTVAQATANTESTVKGWLIAKIYTLTGMTIAANDITITGFSAASSGTASNPIGTNGSFTFTVKLKKTNSAELTTDSKSVTITATQVYLVTVNAASNGTVSADQTALESGKKVTLTISPETGYELGTLSVYKTDAQTTTVSVSGTGTTRTFTMPAYNVTVAASFTKTENQKNIEKAQTLIEGMTNVTVLQTRANTTSELQNWMAAEINALAEMPITVGVNDITISNLVPAIAGTVSDVTGTNGSFKFSVKLQKTGTTTINTTVKDGTITATNYTEPSYTITASTDSHGTISTDVSSSKQGSLITITITPSEGYELSSITTTPTVTLSGTGNTRTFIMPASNITITAAFSITEVGENKEAVENAKIAIEGGSYRIAQATANTTEAVRAWLVSTLNYLYGSLYNLEIRSSAPVIGDVSLISLTPAINGSFNNPNGTNGSFKYQVTLTRGGLTVLTKEISGIIIATPLSIKSINLTKTGDLTVKVTSTGNVETGNMTMKLSGDNANLFKLDSYTLSSLAAGKETKIEIKPNTTLHTGIYKVTLTVYIDNLVGDFIDITYNVVITDIDNPNATKLTAWTQNGMLHVKGLKAGKIWSVIGINGSLVYRGKAESSGSAVISLPAKGIYIVISENQTIKIVD